MSTAARVWKGKGKVKSDNYKIKGKKLGWILLVAVLVAACSQTAPQRPSQRKGQAPQGDSTQLALLEMNQQLAAAADKQLTQLAQEQDEPYALYDSSTWAHIIDRGDETTRTPQTNEEWTVHMRVYDLSERLLVDSEASYHIGKHELPLSVETVITDLHHGARARLLAPWYASFGMQGTAQIPAYENVIIEIELR